MTNGGNAIYFMRNESIFCIKMQINRKGLKKNRFFIDYMSISSYIRSVIPKTKRYFTYAEIQNL